LSLRQIDEDKPKRRRQGRRKPLRRHAASQ
jgi:hypothetical protein